MRRCLFSFFALTLAACSGTTEGRGVPSSLDPSMPAAAPETPPPAPPNDVPPDPETLFDAPAGTPTANTIYGSWAFSPEGKTMFGMEDRLWIGASKLLFARRCTQDGTSVIVSVTAAIRVDDKEITILESKNETKDLETRSSQTTCTAAVVVTASNYVVNGLTLTFPPSSTKGATVGGEWIKLSD
jgi:hypothetical protein